MAPNTYQLMYSACLDTFGPVLTLCPFLLSPAFQIAIHDCLLWQRLQKKNSLNEKAKSIRKSWLSAKRPLISRKYKEHRSERGCGAFPTPPQQCVRLWHVRVKPQTQARCQGSCFLRAEQSLCPAGCWGGSCWWRSSSITANNCNQAGKSSPSCFQPQLFSAKEREWGLIWAQRYN